MKRILFSLFVCFFLFLFHGDAFAANFEDDFTSPVLDPNKWGYFESYDETVKLENGYLIIPATDTNRVPFIYTKNAVLPHNFFLSYKFKYEPLSNNGVGLMLVNSNLDLYNFMLDQNQYRVFSIWNEGSSGYPLRFQVFASKCYAWVFECENTKTIFIGDQLDNTNEYEVQVTKIDNEITTSFYDLNNSINYSFPPVTLDPNIQINHIFIGHPPIPEVRNNERKYWSTLNVDYIRVTELPSSTQNSPIIFLPGYMGSWNLEDMVANTSTHTWTRNPVEKVYDNFFDTMHNLGYVDGDNLVRYDYDFRRPLPEISQKFQVFLNNFLSDKPEGTKAILIGHSFGGLLAKQYLQDAGSDKIEKVITVGTPHEGVLDTYPLLANGEMYDADIWEKAAFEIISRSQGKNFLNKKEVVKNILPSAKDLLPIFNDGYLKSENGNLLTSSFENQNLINLKNSFNFQNIFNIIRGTGTNTKRYFVLESQSLVDRALGNWPDGKIKSAEFSNEGDGTVLTMSSNIQGVSTMDLQNLNHWQIASKKEGVEKILEAAGIPFTEDKIVENPVPNITQALMLLLHSPAEIKITDLQTGESAGKDSQNLIENSISSDGNKFVFLPTEDGKRYKIEVIGNGNGEYQLDVASISISTPSSNLTFTKKIQNSEDDTFEIDYHEKENLISLADKSPENSNLSLRETLSDLSNFISTSSASFEIKNQTKEKTDDLIADSNLINKLVSVNHNESQASEKSQQILMKTFSLKNSFANLTREEKIQVANKILEIARLEKEMFVVVNNTESFVTGNDINDSRESANEIDARTLSHLEAKINSGEANEFEEQSYLGAKNFISLADQEFDSLLLPESHMSLQIARYLLHESF